MATTVIRVDASVRCTDGECGHVTDVVVDERLRAVTHLVVEPAHRSGLGRLVPVDLIGTVTDDIGLRCTVAAFERLDAGEETQLEPGSNGGYGGYGLGQAVPGALVGRSSFGVAGGSPGDAFDPVVRVSLPAGTQAVRDGQVVRATDGDVGRVQGLVVDGDGCRLVAVLLREGHLWGRTEFAVPVTAVDRIDEAVHLSLTRREVEDLPRG